jgi:hypothetical protein
MKTATITPTVLSAAELAYVDRFEELALNIGYYFDDSEHKEFRYLRLLWEIADNQPEAAMADCLFDVLRNETDWPNLRLSDARYA